MKLRELEIECFGIFSGYQVQFPGNGLQVVYGPNETGKSTLLQLIREVLFGFPVRSPYAFAEHTGAMAATARIELADGSQIRFRRRKGRTNEVVGERLETGEVIDKPALQRSLGNASAELFQHVFGFSLHELAAGEQSLQDAKLSEALYGGALGGLSRFQSVLQDLVREHEQLFSPAATKRPINQLLSDLKARQKELKAAQLRPRDYAVLERAAHETDVEVDRLREQRDTLRREQERCRRLGQAVELWQRRRELLRQLSALEVPEGLSRFAREQYESGRIQRDRVAAEWEDFRQEAARIEKDLQTLSPRQELIERAADIQRLAQQLDKIRGFRADIGKRQHEAQLVKERVTTRLRELDPDWTLPHLDQFRTSLARRSAVEDLQCQMEALQNQQRDLLAQRPAVAADIDAMRKRLAEISAELASPALVDLVDGAAEYQSRCEKLEEGRRQDRDWAARELALEGKLKAPFAQHVSNIRQLPVPMATVVSEFRQRLAELDQQLDRSHLQVERVRVDLEQCRDECATLHATTGVPDRAQLDTARARRERGWQFVRRRYIEGESIPQEVLDEWLNGTGTSLPDAYVQSVAAADSVADERQRKAETVARQEQLAAEVVRFEQRWEREVRAHEEIRQLRDECWQAWRALWAPCGIEPASPDAMLDWLRTYDEFSQVSSQRTTLAAHLHALETATGAYEAALAQAVADPAMTAAGRLAEVRRRVAQGQAATLERKSYESQLPRKELQLATLEHELAEVDRRCEKWSHQWRALMDEFGFPHTWSASTATKILTGLSEARVEQESVVSLERRVADMQEGMDLFERQVRQLCQEVAPSLADEAADNAVEELTRLLDHARQDKRELQHLRKEKQLVDARCAAKSEQLRQGEATIAQLFQAAGVDCEETFLEVMCRVLHWHDLRDQLADLEQRLVIVRGDEDPGTFEASLATADAAELDSRQRLLQLEFDKADAQFNNVLQRKGVTIDKLRSLDCTSQAAGLAQDMENTRSQLREAVDQWAPRVLARHFMQRAMQRFEREHQPQMLVDVGRLFQRMTLGRYVEITRKLDDQGTLQVRQADGKLKEPQQLSTGTREQLYLAIRLAYVLHYCRDAEPLPIVMDDVLVNFDDQRAGATLDALNEIAAQIQLILLTCHRSTLELIQGRLPQLEFVSLQP
ncbi:MAG: AAA family ATPase [Pirellulaceae bacterium]